MSHAAQPPGARKRAAPRGRPWPFAVGLAASLLLHWAALSLYPTLPDAPASETDPSVRAALPLRALQAVRITETGPSDPSAEEAPVEIDAALPDGVVPETPAIDDLRYRFLPAYEPAADRLRAGQGDPRLWTPIAPELIEPTPDEVLRMEIVASLAAMADSAATEAEARRRATDWTYTDSEGKKWGAQDGVVYLGGIPLPIPFGFAAPPDYDGDRAARAYRFSEIDRQVGTRAVQLTWKERVKFMRLRREAQRAAEKAEEAEASKPPPTPPAPPDTLRSRGRAPAVRPAAVPLAAVRPPAVRPAAVSPAAVPLAAVRPPAVPDAR